MIPNATYDLDELAGATSVSPRTIRFYVQVGLLPPAGGPGGRYGESHRRRLQLIRHLRDRHQPIEKISEILGDMSDDDITSLLAGTEAPPSGAAEYARWMLSTQPEWFRARTPIPGEPASPDRTPVPQTPPVGIPRSQWERFAVTPEVEIHVRRVFSSGKSRRVQRLLREALRILTEEPEGSR